MRLLSKHTFGIAAFTVAMLASCEHSPRLNHVYFSDNAVVYAEDDITKGDTIRGKLVIPECMGASRAIVADSVICVSRSLDNGMFQLFSLSGDSLATVGNKGSGPNDFTTAVSSGRWFDKNGQTILWITDVNSAKLKQFNLTRSIEEKRSVVDEAVDIRPMVVNAILTGDTLYQETSGDSNFNLLVSSTKDGRVIYDEPVYTHNVENGDHFQIYYSPWAMSPDGRHIAIAMRSINQINVFDTSDFSRLAISLGNVKGPDEILDKETFLPVWIYYGALALSDSNIYAFYENQPYEEPEDYKPTNGELHIIGFDGKVKAVMPLDRKLIAISYSPRDKKIYGTDYNENVYSYDVADYE